jgi:ubiquinone/menaquinone biosynthesis C-methylase UbiE
VSPDSKDLSRDRFGRHAREYVESESHAAGDDLDRLLTLAAPEPQWIALDIATGGGHTAIALAPYVSRMVALDLTPEMLGAAEEHAGERGVPGIDFVLGDAELLPFDSGTFDLVTCRIAAHHFPRVGVFLAEVARVLVPGGRFVLQDQCVPNVAIAGAYVNVFERLRDPSHACAYSEEAWTTLIERAGMLVDASERFEKRHTLDQWAAMQSVSDEDVIRLHELIDEAPGSVREWMRPEGDRAKRTFAIHHVVIAARVAL